VRKRNKAVKKAFNYQQITDEVTVQSLELLATLMNSGSANGTKPLRQQYRVVSRSGPQIRPPHQLQKFWCGGLICGPKRIAINAFAIGF